MRLSTIDSPTSGPWAMPTATARLSSMIWRAHDRRQLRIESGDARPVGIARRPRLGVAGDNGRLEGVEAARSAQLARPPERLHPPPDLELVPECAVLVQHEDGLARCVGTRRRARG